MIQVKNISKKFGKLSALSQINLELKQGECIALVGPNGCGKTTLIKTILGMVIPDSGEVLFNGKSIANEFLYRKEIGYMPQIGHYPEHMTIGQILEMIKNIRTGHKLDLDLYNEFALQQLEHKYMRTLSGGTTQKVSATLAFLFNPKVLILDEPTAGLDPIASEVLKEKIIKEKEKGKLILITSHLLNELDDIISEIIFMQESQLIFHNKLEVLKQTTGETKASKAISKILKERKA